MSKDCCCKYHEEELYEPSEEYFKWLRESNSLMANVLMDYERSKVEFLNELYKRNCDSSQEGGVFSIPKTGGFENKSR